LDRRVGRSWSEGITDLRRVGWWRRQIGGIADRQAVAVDDPAGRRIAVFPDRRGARRDVEKTVAEDLSLPPEHRSFSRQKLAHTTRIRLDEHRGITDTAADQLARFDVQNRLVAAVGNMQIQGNPVAIDIDRATPTEVASGRVRRSHGRQQ